MSPRFWGFVLSLCLILLGFASSSAQTTPKNTYVRGYKGGTCYFQPGSSQTVYAHDYDNIVGGWGWSFGSGLYVSCEGAITTTFTWIGPDAPPASVIVTEICSATASSPTSADADNALGVANGVPKYTIRTDPGQSFSIVRNPTPRPAFPTTDRSERRRG